MTTLHDTHPSFIDRSQTETVLYRVAVSALTWRADAEPGYSIEEEQRWCLAPLQGIDPGLPIRVLVVDTILDPSRHRTELVQALVALSDG
ncbi:hypothetical protein [Microbacterium sediminis]|uniref:hypothetical protein n=1 Tax=Microbacterium sediminis TaxID=904291 RepID=UPI001072DBF1|nr:hypothetical protein [Microbacterium sediminis]QBR73332.1 hypothetical protein E3O41_02045 [Microbacterium sediminis]